MSTQAIELVGGCSASGICNPAAGSAKVDMAKLPIRVAKTQFKFKSLCNWVVNLSIGCLHGCPFCYVPIVSTGKMKGMLAKHGVEDPALEWGAYALVRPWDEAEFKKSLQTAKNMPEWKLTQGGHRVVMYSSTTDPYQRIILGDDPDRRRELQDQLTATRRRSMELIRDESDLGIRVQTRFPKASEDFDIYESLGDRVVLGVSVSTMRDDLRRVYEPKIAPTQMRLDMLQEARNRGISVYVALAPVPPECSEQDIYDTMAAIKEVEPITVFAEPLNLRGKNVTLVKQSAERVGVEIMTDVYGDPAEMRKYALNTFHAIETAAAEVGLSDRLHLWPDADLGSGIAMREVEDPIAHLEWLNKWWNRVSEWPGGAI